VTSATPPSVDLTGSPFVELDPFGEDHRIFFRGRESEIENVAANASVSAFTVLYGPSGVGKSSILQAGVVPFLREERGRAVLYFRDWLAKDFEGTIRDLCIRHAEASSERRDPVQATAGRFAKGPWSTHSNAYEGDPFIGPILKATSALAKPLLVVFDQFEDYLMAETASDAFDRRLATLVNWPEARVNLLIGIREDHLSKLDRFRTRIPGVLSNTLRLGPLTYDQARQALTEPIAIYNTVVRDQQAGDAWSITISNEPDDDPVDAILDHASDGPAIQAAAIQLAMTRLWKTEMDAWEREGRIRRRCLRKSMLGALGGVDGILLEHLRDRLAHLTSTQLPIAAEILRRGVDPSGEKRAVYRADLSPFPAAIVDEVLTSFETKKMLRHPPGTQRYELYHQVLARAVREWLADFDKVAAEREAERLRQESERARVRAEQEAQEAKRNAALQQVASEAIALRLEEEKRRVQAEQQRVEAERRETQAQRARAETEKKRAEDNARWLVAVSLALLATVTLVIVAIVLTVSLRSVRDHLAAITWAAAADKEMTRDPALGLIYAARAASATVSGHPLPDAEVALHRAVRSSHLLYGFDSNPSLVATDSRGRYLAVVTTDPDQETDAYGSLLRPVLEIRSHQRFDAPKLRFPQKRPVMAMRFEPDGEGLLVASDNGSVQRIGVSDNTVSQLKLPFAADGSRHVNTIAFSRDGRSVAAVVNGGGTPQGSDAPGLGSSTTWLYADDLHLGVWTEPRQLDAGRVALAAAGEFFFTLSPTGKAVVRQTASSGGGADRTVAYDTTVSVVVPSPDGRFALGIPERRSARSNAEPRGDTAETVDPIVLWSADNGRVCPLVDASTEPIVSTLFSPDGQFVVTIRQSGRGAAASNARIWATASCELVGAPFPAQGLEFAADSSHVLVWTQEHTAELRAIATDARPLTFIGNSDDIQMAAVPADGPIVTASVSRVLVWSRTEYDITIPTGYAEELRAVAVTGDGSTVAVGGDNRSVRIYETKWGALLDDQSVGADVVSLTYSHSGRVLAAGLRDGSIRLFGGGPPITLASPNYLPVMALAFSGDDRLLAYASHVSPGMNVVSVRSIAGGEIKAEQIVPAQIASLQISPDGRAIRLGLHGGVTAAVADPRLLDVAATTAKVSWADVVPMEKDLQAASRAAAWRKTKEDEQRNARPPDNQYMGPLPYARSAAVPIQPAQLGLSLGESAVPRFAAVGGSDIVITTRGSDRLRWKHAEGGQTSLFRLLAELQRDTASRATVTSARAEFKRVEAESQRDELAGPSFDDRVRAVAVSEDGRRLAAGGESGLVQLYLPDAMSQERVQLRPGDHRPTDAPESGDSIVALRFSNGRGDYLSSLRADGTVRVYDLGIERTVASAGMVAKGRMLPSGACGRVRSLTDAGCPNDDAMNAVLDSAVDQAVPGWLGILRPAIARVLKWML